jgi:hypothetical protein
MSRTRFTTTKKRQDGKQQYNSLNLPSFLESSSDVVINVNNATRLDSLAQQFFGDATLWWVIALYNNLGDASLFVKDRTFLRIPSNIETVFNEIRNLN